MYMYMLLVTICTYDIWKKERKRERKKERQTPETMEKWKMRVASGGIRTHDTLYSRQMLYQLSYPGSSAGRVRILGFYVHVISNSMYMYMLLVTMCTCTCY